jgi:hypothetical protein
MNSVLRTTFAICALQIVEVGSSETSGFFSNNAAHYKTNYEEINRYYSINLLVLVPTVLVKTILKIERIILL